MNLFGRAKKMMGTWSPPPPSRPHYFRVICPQGHRIEGQRTESYQALRCPDCGEGVFVLPRSPLPEPKVPANRAPRPVAARQSWADDDAIPLSDPVPFNQPQAEVEVEFEPEEAPVDEVEWVDEEEAEPAASAPNPSPANIAEFDPDVHIDEPAPPPRPKPRHRPIPQPEPVAVRERVSIGTRLWRNRNALLFLAVILAVGAAVGNRLWRQKLESLPRLYERGKTEGLAALDKGDFHSAKQILRESADAIRILGDRLDATDEVEEVRHAADEAAIYADLVSIPLDALIEKAAKAGSREAWLSTFDTLYKGQSIVVEAHVSAVPDPARADSAYEIDYRIGYGQGPIPAGRGRIDLKGFRLAEDARPKLGDRLAFGARLAAVELDVARNEWAVKLDPDSGVFLQRVAPLRILNVIDEESEAEAVQP